MARRFQNAQQGPDGKFYAIDPESGDQIQVIPISRMDEDGNMVQSFETVGGDQDTAAARQLMGFNQARDAAAAPVNWTQALPSNLSAFNVPMGVDTIRAGDTVPAASVADIQALGLSPMSSPVESVGLQDFLSQTGMSLPQFQAATASQPFTFNQDGTATFDPSAQQQSFGYTPTNWDSYWQIPLAAIGAMVGANALGLGQAAAAAPAAEGAAALSSLPAELSNFTLAGPGTGIGGVGSANVGFNAAGLGLTPELVAAGGGAGAMGLSGGLGLTLPATGAIPSAAAALEAGLVPSSGVISDVINLPTFTNPMEVPTSAVAPSTPLETSIPALDVPAPTLAQPGQGVGGVGTAGQGLSLGAGSTGGAIGATAAELAAAGGVALPALSGIGAGTGAGLGLNLPAGGAIGSATGMGSGIGSGLTVPTSAAAAATGGGAAASGAQTLSRLLKDQFGIDIAPGTLDLLGTGASTLLGMYGANQQARSAENLYNRFFDLGAPYRQSLANLEANPNSFYSSPMVQGALQQGSDAMARSLSAKVGNPILNPTALQEMQNFTTRGMLDAYNNRFSQLASAGQLGVSQSAPLGMQANAAQGGTANALGAGLRSVFGNQPDYTQQMLDILKNRGLGGSGVLP